MVPRPEPGSASSTTWRRRRRCRRAHTSEETQQLFEEHAGDEPSLVHALLSATTSTGGHGPGDTLAPPRPADIAGDYHIDPAFRYAVACFSLAAEDIVDHTAAPRGSGGPPGPGFCDHALGTGTVALEIKQRLSRTTFSSSLFGRLCSWMLRRGPEDVLYTFTVSTNGTVRFHIAPDTALLTQAVLLFMDSESVWGALRNLRHAYANGCFCLGRFGSCGDTGRTFLARYNRWQDRGGPTPYWVAVQVPPISKTPWGSEQSEQVAG
mmetsp:Transcript_14889/g.41847  ORF Transcript_14889/g.41847 Transcript_14889/m.41847 type:complete len:265 (-) Transcript_14889:173-967(-)